MRKEMIKHYTLKTLKIIGTILSVIICTLGFLICLSIRWMFQTWSNLSMDELMYHLNAPLDGTNHAMIMDYLNQCVGVCIIIIMLMIVCLVQFRKNKIVYSVIISSVTILSIILVGVFVHGAWGELNISEYAANQGTYSNFIDTYYIDPKEVNLEFPEQKRNLIYIFLESMETTYSDKEDGGAFAKNVIPELTSLAQTNEDFSGSDDQTLNGGYAMPGATWTVGAMFAQSSGIPLDIPMGNNEMYTQDSFFPSVSTIGDILNKQGYNQTLLIGSDATFGGRRLLYEEHGNFNILDYNYAVEQGWIPKDYFVWWGYEDERLFENAKNQLTDLAASDEPFNLTMLTVDTHFEDGYVCDLCGDEYGDNQYANVMACSSKQVDQFVKWIQKQDFYENTTIVISGDHPTMDSDFCEGVPSDYTRKVYTTYINPAISVDNNERRNYTTFDDFPTTLASLGVQIEGNRLGLGTNLFSSEQTLTERFGIEKVSSELSRKSKKMEELASIHWKEGEEDRSTVPVATVEMGTHDEDNGVVSVYIKNIQGVESNIKRIPVAIWHDEDRNDLKWADAEQTDEGEYVVYISLADFENKTGEYHIEPNIIIEDGTQYTAASVTETVD